MILTNFIGEIISITLIILIIGGSLAYIILAKLKGQKCIGCPDSKTCNTKNLKKLCCQEIDKLKEENKL